MVQKKILISITHTFLNITLILSKLKFNSYRKNVENILILEVEVVFSIRNIFFWIGIFDN